MTELSKGVEFTDIDSESTPDADDAGESLRYKGIGTSTYYPTGVYLAENVQNAEENIYSKTSYDYVDRSEVYYDEQTLEATTADYVYVTENCTQPRHRPVEKDFAEHQCPADLSCSILWVFMAIAISVIIATAVVFTVFAFSLFALKEDIRTLSETLSPNSTLSERLSDLKARSDNFNMISSLNESVRTMSGDVDSLNSTVQDFIVALEEVERVLYDTAATFQVVGVSLGEVSYGIVENQNRLNAVHERLNSYDIRLDIASSEVISLLESVQNLENN